jgi:hypothetical protein
MFVVMEGLVTTNHKGACKTLPIDPSEWVGIHPLSALNDLDFSAS